MQIFKIERWVETSSGTVMIEKHSDPFHGMFFSSIEVVNRFLNQSLVESDWTSIEKEEDNEVMKIIFDNSSDFLIVSKVPVVT